jgi:hypothetical protein
MLQHKSFIIRMWNDKRDFKATIECKKLNGFWIDRVERQVPKQIRLKIEL